ncbi:PPC domain-containing protein [Frateuria sp. STR12]|nr:PPC domain-containing protein [Frateuria sp. STR12]
MAGQAGSAGVATVYKLDVPAGALALNLRTYGGTGDVSVYVKVGAPGGPEDYDYKSVHRGNNEAVANTRPVAGTYYVTVVGETAYSGLGVMGSFLQVLR